MKPSVRLSRGTIEAILITIAAFLASAALAAGQEPIAEPQLDGPQRANLAVQEPGIGRRGEATSASRAQVESQRATARERFIRGDVKGALDALNVIGEPRVSRVAIDGLVHSKRTDIESYIGVGEGDLLTSGKMARVNRQLGDLPAASSAKARYDLLPDSVILRPIVAERKRAPAAIFDWMPTAVRAIFTQEALMPLSNVTGHSEVWLPSVRWAQGRPRARLQFASPAPGFLPGVLEADTFWSRQEYLLRTPLLPEDRRIIEETYSRAGVGLSDWVTGWLQWRGGGAFARIAEVNYLGANATLNTRLLEDHVATSLRGEWFTAADSQRSFQLGEFSVAARSTTNEDSPMLTSTAGFSIASREAPFATWPSASSGSGYTALLRAHRLYEVGLLVGNAFGRQLAFANVEYLHPIPIRRMGPSTLKGAFFVDTARAHFRPDSLAAPLHVDVGAGIRINTTRNGNQVRLDVARGLKDGLMRVSAGYVAPWGKR